MASPPTLDGEKAYSGDVYTLQVVVEDQTIGSKTFAAQARRKPGATGDPVVTFDVDAADGTGADTGNILLVLELTGVQTAALAALGQSIVHCDLQQTDGSLVTTLLRWPLRTEKDVTR